MNKYTSGTRNEIINMYCKHGINNAIKLAYGLLESHLYKEDREFLTGVHGEVCETVLEVVLREFIKRNNIKDWYIAKSLIIPIKNTTTELDITLFTPKMIYIFECKCYGGEKEIINECTIHRSGQQDMNVYEQNCFHRDMLDELIRTFRFTKVNTRDKYKLIYFDFSTGSLVDKRRDKSLMSVVNYKNLTNLFKDYFDLPNQWDMKKILPAVKKLEDNHDKLEKLHLKRLGVS